MQVLKFYNESLKIYFIRVHAGPLDLMITSKYNIIHFKAQNLNPYFFVWRGAFVGNATEIQRRERDAQPLFAINITMHLNKPC